MDKLNENIRYSYGGMMSLLIITITALVALITKSWLAVIAYCFISGLSSLREVLSASKEIERLTK